MNLVNILYEPYVIIILTSILITFIAYLILRNQKDDIENKDKYNTPKILLYTFISSCIILVFLKFGLEYMNNNKFFQKGASLNNSDRLTVVADDIDTTPFE